ncbi:hypothetical protein Tco_0171921, partial [Tanacetum coccineum]
LFDFIISSDPFEVKVGERTLVAGEVSLLKETEDRVIPLSSEVIIVVDHTILDELKDAAGGKGKKRVISLNESGSAPDATVVCLYAVVAPSLALDYQDESDFVQRGNSGSRPAAQRLKL